MSSSLNEVIDVDFEPDLREYPRHIRKSTERLLHRLKRPPLLDGQNEVLRTVLSYCASNPRCYDINLIVEQCHALLNNIKTSGISIHNSPETANPNPKPQPNSSLTSNQHDNTPDGNVDALVQMLPSHGEKAFLRYLKQNPHPRGEQGDLKRLLYLTVREFCDTYPEVQNMQAVLKYVRNTLHDRGTGTGTEFETETETRIDLSGSQEVDLTESACEFVDDACDLTRSRSRTGRTSSVTLTPRDRILRIFPDALGSKVDVLLEQQAAALASMNMTMLRAVQGEDPAVVDLSCAEQQVDQLLQTDFLDRAVELVVQLMLEKGYEKAAADSRLPHRDNADSAAGPDYDYGAENHSALSAPSSEYVSQAKDLLEHNFPFLRVAGLQRLLQKHRNRYYPTMMEVEGDLSAKAFFGDLVGSSGCRLGSFALGLGNLQTEEEQELGAAMTASDHIFLRAKCQMSSLGLSAKVVKASRAVTALDSIVTEGELQKELRWVLKKRIAHFREERVRLAEERMQRQAEEEGALIDCGCCCSPLAFELLVQCSEGHLFCRECLQRYAEQTVFGDGRSNLKCMDSSGSVPCGGRFSDATLKKVLSEKVFGKYQEALARDALKAADIGNLVACHACGMQVMMDEDAGLVLDCPSCGIQTCKQCGEESHIPLRCNEVERKGDTERRTRLEEAMTKARVRQCPGASCKTRFYKTEGCNKMVCTCGVLICYLCRANICKEGYAHFCQVPLCTHSSCGKCKLFTNSQEDDRQAMLDAGIKTLADMQLLGVAAADQSAPNANANLEQIEKLLEGGLPKPKPTVPVPAAAAALLPWQMPGQGFGPPQPYPPHLYQVGPMIMVGRQHRRGRFMAHAQQHMPILMPGQHIGMGNHMPPPAAPLQIPMPMPLPAAPIAPVDNFAPRGYNGTRKRTRLRYDLQL